MGGKELSGQWFREPHCVDVSESSIALMQNYRQGAVLAVAVAVWVIAFLIWYQRRQLAQLAWIALTVAAAISITIVSIVLLHGLLTVIHFVALLLVMGLGLDYALFLSRTESTVDRAASSQAVLACAVSTTLAFGILAASSIPVLKFLGFTVAVGSASSYLIAVAGSRLFSRKIS
jgi:predicted exporter